MGLRRLFKDFNNKRNYLKELKKRDTPPVCIDSNITADQINIPFFPEHVVSIIISCDDQPIQTLNCLASVSNNLPKIAFEIILINNSDNEYLEYTKIPNISILNFVKSADFLVNVNQGIKRAKGDFIYLLTSNTIVTSGFLDESLHVFNTRKDVGAVGSLFLNPNGTIQETELFFIKKGIEKNNGIPTYSPQVNYTYKTDFCSYNGLLFRKFTDNNEINLFDEQYSAVYFKDKDLCFTLKYIQNKNIYLCPFSKIYHFQEDTHSWQENNLLLENRTIFNHKWHNMLEQTTAKLVQERIIELYDNKSIVVFHDRVPEFDNNSGELRLTEIIKAFVELDYHIILIVPKNRIDNPYNIYFQKLGICVYYDYTFSHDSTHFSRELGLQNPICWFSTGTTFEKRYQLTKSIWPQGKFIFDMVDIHHLRYLRALEQEPTNQHYKKEYQETLHAETFASKHADITVPISLQEASYMESTFSPKKMAVISNVHYSKVNLNEVPSFEDRKDILFIGSQHHPNIDAVRFLADEIMPIVWQTNPSIKLNVVGNLNTLIQDINHPNIKFHGYVPDITTYFYNNKLMVAPLRSGAGVKGKIGQAFEYFLPVITSKIGAEGMELVDNSNAILAESAEEFAVSILSLYTDKSLWMHLQSNSEKSLKPFSKEKLRTTLMEIISAIH